jgi:hypothetical protein
LCSRDRTVLVTLPNRAPILAAAEISKVRLLEG